MKLKIAVAVAAMLAAAHSSSAVAQLLPTGLAR